MSQGSQARLALLSASTHWPTDDARDPTGSVRQQVSALQHAAGKVGITLDLIAWDEVEAGQIEADWAQYGAVLPLMVWNYARHPDRFSAFLGQLQASGVRVENALPIVQINRDKGYLAALGDLGAPTIPTRFVEQADPQAVEAARQAFGSPTIVVKPRAGAGAWRQVRLNPGDPWPQADQLPEGPALLQPFLPDVVSQGEFSLLYFDGVFSHGLVKQPARGDYRTQTKYGALETAFVPDAHMLGIAGDVLATFSQLVPGCSPLYGRVDLVHGANGQLLVMELELIEPFLYLAFDPLGADHAASRLLRALAGRLGI